ncbi:MAG: DNRLRE domain-containing protein [Lacibacter sp.]
MTETIQLPIDFVTLSGSGKDEDGSIVAYLWSQISGPNNSAIQAAGSPATKVTGLVTGTYRFQLKVTDNSGATGVDSVSITVIAAVNKVPSSNAGNSAAITLPTDFVTLSGSGSDTDGTIVAYLWSQVSGPFSSQIDNPGAASTQISGLKEGKYVFQLMVTDNKGATGVDTTSIVVNKPVIQILTLQPAAVEAEVGYIFVTQSCTTGTPYATAANTIQPQVEDMPVGAWTFDGNGCATGQIRSFLKFPGLNAIPQNATIISAKLSLYGVASSGTFSVGNSYYPGSGYNPFGTNELWIKRVTSNWVESSVTWNTQPSVIETNRVAIPASTSQWGYNVTDIDVTEMVKSMVNTSNANYGFCFMLQNETHYRSMTFGSPNNTNAAKRPKLIIEYK